MNKELISILNYMAVCIVLLTIATLIAYYIKKCK